MSAFTIDGEFTEASKGRLEYRVEARPAHNIAVKFLAREDYPDGPACVLRLDGPREYPVVVSSHRSLSMAVRSANYRAKRYVNAYKTPRGKQRTA